MLLCEVHHILAVGSVGQRFYGGLAWVIMVVVFIVDDVWWLANVVYIGGLLLLLS